MQNNVSWYAQVLMDFPISDSLKDARPDFSLQSSDFRMEVSCAAAFNHINTFIHPQATFIDASGQEEIYFLKGLKAKANSIGRTVIELPDNSEQNLMWATLLDSQSLSGKLVFSTFRTIADLNSLEQSHHRLVSTCSFSIIRIFDKTSRISEESRFLLIRSTSINYRATTLR